jgi:hypothetical protein
VLWWGDGGYLRDIVENVSLPVGCEFHIAEQTLLELSTGVPRDRTIRYVP